MRIAGTTVELHRFPSIGSTLSYSLSMRAQKWRHAVMLLGGVIANALVASTLIGLAAWHLTHGYPHSPALVSLLFGASVSEVLVVISNLWPRRITGQGNITATDGQHFVDLCKAKDFNSKALSQHFNVEYRELMAQGRFSEGLRRCEQRRLQYPHDPMLLGQLLHAAERADGARAAFDTYRAHIGEIEAKDLQSLAWVKANGAWHALLTDDPALLGEAAALSEEAFEVLPSVPEIRGTRGAYHARAGHHERALPMLLDGVRKADDKIDRADFARFLAECHEGLAKLEIAAELRKLSEHFRALAQAPARY
ncbi:MAG: hypothetical protein GC190_17290 [Alphaproteobacteria bacterium]|nr:hypothetical protein [Alphaproteobacteria bacterium]